MSKPFNDEMSAGRTFGNFNSKHTLPDGKLWFITGYLSTPNGYATLYIQNAPEPSSSADFIWKGRWQRRSWPIEMTEYQLKRNAAAMVKEIVAGKFKKS